jgi:hypothetical protein
VVRDKIVTKAVSFGYANVPNMTFQGIIQACIKEVELRQPIGVQYNWSLFRFLWHTNAKSEESIMRDIETSIRKQIPTSFELLTRLLKIAKTVELGFEMTAAPNKYMGDDQAVNSRGADAGNA